MKKLKSLITAACIVLASSSVLAQESPKFETQKLNGITEESTFKERLWITPGMASLHFDRNQGFNEANYGFGAEYAVTKDWAVAGGFFRNSEYTNSNYLVASYQPLDFFGFRLGVLGGVMDGYHGPQDKYKGKPFTVFMPVLSYEKGNFGVNMMVVPSVNVNGDKLYGTLAFQLKFKPLNW